MRSLKGCWWKGERYYFRLSSKADIFDSTFFLQRDRQTSRPSNMYGIHNRKLATFYRDLEHDLKKQQAQDTKKKDFQPEKKKLNFSVNFFQR